VATIRQHAVSAKPPVLNSRLEVALVTVLAAPAVVGGASVAALRTAIRFLGPERVVEGGLVDRVLSWVAPSSMATALIGIPGIVLATVIGGVVLGRSPRQSREWRLVAAALAMGWLATAALIWLLVAATLAHNAG
jgi:hypothetical protein